MRRPFINPDSLENFYAFSEPMGFRFEINNNRYRNQPLSTVEKFVLKVDGKVIDPCLITFCLNGKKFAVWDLPKLEYEYWALQTPAVIEVDQIGGLSEGQHEIDVDLQMHVGYICSPFYITDVENQVHMYPANQFGETRTLWLQK